MYFSWCVQRVQFTDGIVMSAQVMSMSALINWAELIPILMRVR